MHSSISKKELRDFGIIVGFLFPALIGYVLPLLRGDSFVIWTLLIGMPLLVFGIFKPKLLSMPYRCWLSLGRILGWINSHLILGLVFILILQPIALFMKIIGYDPLRKKRNNKKSYREENKNRLIDLNKIF